MDIKIQTIKKEEKPIRFRSEGKLHWKIGIRLEGKDDDLDKISFVEYELHPTFKQRIRHSRDRDTNFEIEIRTYGYFKIKATLFFNDSTSIVVNGFVKWDN